MSKIVSRPAAQAISATNDFVVKFANVNGSGSASANELFARSILRMGVPVSPRNIFPSNIQGLPTWYEVRVSGSGYLGRRGGVDLMVPMNPQTWDKDLAEVEPGGYVFYDSTRPVPAANFRDDINVIGMPLTELAASAYNDPRQRQLFKNIIYVGALASLLGIDPEAIEGLFAEQFKGKERLIQSNVDALHLGLDYANQHLPKIGLKIQASDEVGDRIFIDGNSAAGLGCVFGGATVCAWYPITPSTSVAEAFESYCKKYRVDSESGQNKFAVVQAEDELSSVGMVLGAGWNGARAFTATSGPGISLMTEFIGLAYFAEVPITIINIQRGGPSTGMPTRTQQADITACAYASHGDTKHVLLFPEDPAECFEMAAAALDLADRLQTPVFLMSDLDIGMNRRLCEPLKWLAGRAYDRGKIMTAQMLEDGVDFGRYLDVDGDGVPYRTLPATHAERGAYFTRGTTRDRYARYSEEGSVYVDNVDRLLRKFDTARSLVPAAVIDIQETPCDIGVIYFGSTSSAMVEALDTLRSQSVTIDAMRVRAFPFGTEVSSFIEKHHRIFVVEQNRDGQFRSLLINELEVSPERLLAVLHFDGTPITARFIVASINAALISRDRSTDSLQR